MLASVSIEYGAAHVLACVSIEYGAALACVTIC